jgi:hypothetical protein
MTTPRWARGASVRVFLAALVFCGPAGCAAESSLRRGVVGTWEQDAGMYHNVISYHSDGTWVMTIEIRPPSTEKGEADGSPPLGVLLRCLISGSPYSHSTGTWRVIDGRLVSSVTSSAAQEVPVGLICSDEIVAADAAVLKLRPQAGELEVWSRVGSPPNAH